MIVYAATSNAGKLAEFRAAAAATVQIEPLPGFDSLPPAVEDGATFEENARRKAEHYGAAAPAGAVVFAEDSGLSVPALGGAPGVLSARYAGADSNDDANNRKLLADMAALPATERQARFTCVIAAARDGKVLRTFEGHADGLIAYEPTGSGGFGYDPLFLLPALGRTFAELTPEEKLRYSHRGQAFRAFLTALESL